MTKRSGSLDKSFAIVGLTIVSWVSVAIWSWQVFRPTIPAERHMLVEICLGVVHLCWMLVWLWGLHNFWHQTLSFFLPVRSPGRSSPAAVPIVTLYTTCDDFDPEACESALNQTGVQNRLIICDDSSDETSRRAIDAWVAHHGANVTISRRANKNGFKAGNLNHAIAEEVGEEFMLICDADELMPPDFASRLFSWFGDDEIAFVQGSHRARTRAATQFAALLGPGIELFFKWSLPLRNRFGFVCCFGHGVMIRRSVWSAIGGFPEIVAEDIGFASRALVAGYRGVFDEGAVAEEAFPPTYKAFVANRCRVVRGTIQYFREDLKNLLDSRASLTEKLDVLLTFSTCYAGLIIAVNLLSGAVVAHVCALAGYSRISGWLLLLYLVGPLTPIVPLALKLVRESGRYIRYMCIAAMAYTSLVPVTAFKSIEETLELRPPVFDVTGRVGRHGQGLREHAWTIASGIVLSVLGVVLQSPTLGAVLAVAIMFLLGPALCFTDRPGLGGLLARNCALVPYLALAWITWATSIP